MCNEWLFYTFFFWGCFAVLPENYTGLGRTLPPKKQQQQQQQHPQNKNKTKDIWRKTWVAYGNVFQALINSLVCWFCTDTLVLILFQTVTIHSGEPVSRFSLEQKLVLSYPPVHTSPGLPSVPQMEEIYMPLGESFFQSLGAVWKSRWPSLIVTIPY